MKKKGSLYSYLIAVVAVLLVFVSTYLIFFSTADHQISTTYDYDDPTPFGRFDPSLDDGCIALGLRAPWWDRCILKRLRKMKDDAAHDKNKKTLIVITPTYVHANQSQHFCELTRTLVTLPYDVVWIVVEAGGPTNETGKRFKKSRQLLNVTHIGFDYNIPSPFPSEAREKMESQMRLQALRVVKEEKLDGIVIFADETDYHDDAFFDEIQQVKWIGSVPIKVRRDHIYGDNKPIVQGPACNSSHQITGWRILKSCRGCNITGNEGIVLPEKLKWSGFVMNSRLISKETKYRPEWINDLDMVMAANQGDESPLSFVKDSSMVEPLGGCGKQWFVCWHCQPHGSTGSYCWF